MGHRHENPHAELLQALSFGKQTDAIREKVSRILGDYLNRSMGKNTELHHYMGAAGLLGLLTKRLAPSGAPPSSPPLTLWASLATHLNDSEEVIHGQRRVWDELEGQKRLRDKLLPSWREPWAQVYVTCFSEKPDDLSQWRAYANGGRGYMVSLDRELLAQGRLLSSISYGVGSKDDNARDVPAAVAKLLKVYDLIPKNKRRSAPVVTALRRGLALASAVHKPSAFASEAEHRILFWCEGCGDLAFRKSQDRIVPYHPIDIETAALKSITIGPGLDATLEIPAVETLLQRAGLGGGKVKVGRSGVSLRVS